MDPGCETCGILQQLLIARGKFLEHEGHFIHLSIDPLDWFNNGLCLFPPYRIDTTEG